MAEDIAHNILTLLKKDDRLDYTIPDIMKALDVRSREKTVTTLARLEERKMVEISREKGKTKFYRIRRAN